MAHIITVNDLSHPGLAPYARLTERQLRSKRDPEEGLFIAESPKVIGHALDAGCVPVSLLMGESTSRARGGTSWSGAAACRSTPGRTACWNPSPATG